jgi:hypothetical protein
MPYEIVDLDQIWTAEIYPLIRPDMLFEQLVGANQPIDVTWNLL